MTIMAQVNGEELLVMTATKGPIRADKLEYILIHERICFNDPVRPSTSAQTISFSQLSTLRKDPFAFDGVNLNMTKRLFERNLTNTHQQQYHINTVADINPFLSDAELTMHFRDNNANDSLFLLRSTTLPYEKQSFRTKYGNNPLQMSKYLERDLLYHPIAKASFVYQDIFLPTLPLIGVNSWDWIVSKYSTLVEALAMTQQQTHTPIFFRFIPPRPSGGNWTVADACQLFSPFSDAILSFFQYLKRNNIDVTRTVLCYCDFWLWSSTMLCHEINAKNQVLMKGLLSLGVILSFNLIGFQNVSDHFVYCSSNSEASLDSGFLLHTPTDRSIIESIKMIISFANEKESKLSESTVLQQLLFSHSISQKIQLKEYGGGGYEYIMESFLPQLQSEVRFNCRSYSTKELGDIFLHDNPLRLLKWYTLPDIAPAPKDYLTCSFCSKAFEPIVGEYFSKYEFNYCGTKCLRKHRLQNFKAL